MNQRSTTAERNLEVMPSVCPHQTTPDCTNNRTRRRLVDYTKCRRDGTPSSNTTSSNIMDGTSSSDSTKQDIRLGLPTCRALETSLASMMLTKPIQIPQDEEQDDDRIDFFLKIVPKSQRKSSRVSTLDRADSRRGGLLRQMRSLSSRSVDLDTTTSSFHRHKLVKRSASTPCA
jgi:hypothetical protein